MSNATLIISKKDTKSNLNFLLPWIKNIFILIIFNIRSISIVIPGQAGYTHVSEKHNNVE